MSRNIANAHAQGAVRRTAPWYRWFIWYLIFLVSCGTSVAPIPTSPDSITASPLPATYTPAPLPTAVVNTATPQATPTPTIGTLQMAATPTLTRLDNSEQLQIFDSVWQTVNKNYVYQDFRGVDWEQMRQTNRERIEAGITTAEFYALIKDMIDLLGDDHSRFDTPQEAAMDAALYSGEAEYGGIGVMIRQTDQGMVVVRLAQGAPAQRAGVQLYDLIIGTGDTLFDPDLSDSIDYGALIRGPIGTTIDLRIIRNEQSLTIPVVRNVIPNDAFPEAVVQPTSDPDVALLIIDSFNRNQLDQIVTTALLDYRTTYGTPTGIIIDIRENYGGNIQSMLDVIALFCDGGTIGFQKDRQDQYPLQVASNQTLAEFRESKLLILTSGETASAAEMFASGMRSLANTLIIGETTAGNSENLYPHYQSDGSVLWLAELLFTQNDGTYIDDIGIIPDIAVTQNWEEMVTSQDGMITRAISELTDTP